MKHVAWSQQTGLTLFAEANVPNAFNLSARGVTTLAEEIIDPIMKQKTKVYHS
jgi:hypothetical protein